MDEWPKHGAEARPTKGGTVPIRGTQSFVRVMQWCWRHPGVTALEVLWRWTFGAIAVAVLWREGSAIALRVAHPARLGLDQVTVMDPMDAAARLAEAAGRLAPEVLRLAMWAGPVLLVAWLVLSTAGRTLVLRRVDGSLRARPAVFGALQLIRMVALGLSLAVWFALVRWAAATEVTGPLAAGGQPQLVGYFAIVIVGTLMLFSGWALVSWVFSLAPLVAMRQGGEHAGGMGVGGALRAAAAGGPLRLKLVEINLVMGIVKIALLVLAMVLSACPLPFESVATTGFLVNWTIGVGVLYVLGSDFFHVARLVAYLQLWDLYAEPRRPGENGARTIPNGG